MLINEGERRKASVLIEGEFIKDIVYDDNQIDEAGEIIDAEGLWLIPGVIDDQVHFREPGLTHKADIFTESRAAAAGGITSFMEMPNTIPQTTNLEELENKFRLGNQNSLVNYSFYFGATNDNLKEIRKIDPGRVCGLKIFMGSSTGNMLVDNRKSLEAIFAESPVLIATHCEDESTILRNAALFRETHGEDIPFRFHPLIRTEEACFLSSSLAIELATRHNSRLHILHISTARELSLFRNDIPPKEKKITAEVCVHHLYFDESYYNSKESLIKWNPAIKTATDREALFQGMLDNKLDVIATDHAPHTLVEKENTYFKAPSGGPLVQHALPVMLKFCAEGKITAEKIVEKMCHLPADLFKIYKRGYVRKGYFADLVLINPDSPWIVNKDNILYKCGWSPFEGIEMPSKVVKTMVNGEVVFENGRIVSEKAGKELAFERG